MKKIALLATAALLLSGLVPAPTQAQAQTQSRVRVDGDNFHTGLMLRSGSCVDPWADSTAGFGFGVVTDSNAPLGSRAVQWTPTAEDSARGPMARVDDAASLYALSLQVRGEVDDKNGRVLARFVPRGDGGAWWGLGDLDVPDGEGWRQVDAAAAELDWAYYSDGYHDDEGDVDGQTVQEFLSTRGAGTTHLGFGFGCEGAPVLMDALRVATDSEDRTFNFEGYATRSKLAFPKSSRATKSIAFGTSVRLRLAVRSAVGGQARSGKVVLKHKPSTAERFRSLRTLGLGQDGKVGLRLKPTRTTTYRSSYATRGLYSGSSSRTVKVVVRRTVGAKVSDASPRQGQSIVFRGTQRPSGKAKIKLQRRQGSTWVTVRRTKSSKKGVYRVATSASQVGTSTWRVVAVGGAGLGNGTSRRLTVRTSAKPTPAPSSPPPSSGGSSGDSSGGSSGGTNGGSSGGSNGGSGGGETPPPPPSGPLRTQPS